MVDELHLDTQKRLRKRKRKIRRVGEQGVYVAWFFRREKRSRRRKEKSKVCVCAGMKKNVESDEIPGTSGSDLHTERKSESSERARGGTRERRSYETTCKLMRVDE